MAWLRRLSFGITALSLAVTPTAAIRFVAPVPAMAQDYYGATVELAADRGGKSGKSGKSDKSSKSDRSSRDAKSSGGGRSRDKASAGGRAERSGAAKSEASQGSSKRERASNAGRSRTERQSGGRSSARAAAEATTAATAAEVATTLDADATPVASDTPAATEETADVGTATETEATEQETTDPGTGETETGGAVDVGSGDVPTVVDGPVPTPRDETGNVDETPVQVDGPVPTPRDEETPVAETPTVTEPETPVAETDTSGGTGTDVVTETPVDTGGSGTDVTTETPGGSGGTGTDTAGGSGGGSGSSGGSDTVAETPGSQDGGSGGQTPVAGETGGGSTSPEVVETPNTGGGGVPVTETAGGSQDPNTSTGGGQTGGGSGTTPNGGGSTDKPSKPAPSLVDIVKNIFGGSSTRSDTGVTHAGVKTTTTTTTTSTVTTTPVVTTPVVVAPVAVAPVVVEEVVKAAKQIEVEPKAALTAPRIRYSSGGSSSQNYRRYELTALGLTPHARQVLNALGFKTLSERRSPLLGNRIVARLRTPGNQTAEAALARARSVLPEVTFDLAHLYRPSGEQTPVRYAAKMIGAPLGETCAVPARVGLIDSGVGTHETLAGAKITRKNFVEKGASTNVAHGTAVASILVGDLPGTGPLMPGAQLFSANVFAQDGAGGLRADATAIIAALDWMAAQRVPVVNLSLMGPSNALLDQAVQAAAARGLVMVAAAGNDGPNGAPAYPAAYPAVIAVAAVDARGRPYGNNNRGSYIYVAAPGVDIWGADARGGLAFWTGTSFAAPFVTASLARDVALGQAHDINDGRARIASSARDLGAPGRDPIFGFGLLQSGACGVGGTAVLSAKN